MATKKERVGQAIDMCSRRKQLRASRETAIGSTSAPHGRQVGSAPTPRIRSHHDECGCQRMWLSALGELGGRAASQWQRECVSARRKSSIDASYRKPRPLAFSRVRLSGTHSLNMTFVLTMETRPQHWWKFECPAIEQCGLHQRNA